MATTPGKAKAAAGAWKYRAKPCARKPAASAPTSVPAMMSIPRSAKTVRVAVRGETLAEPAVCDGSLDRRRNHLLLPVRREWLRAHLLDEPRHELDAFIEDPAPED